MWCEVRWCDVMSYHVICLKRNAPICPPVSTCLGNTFNPLGKSSNCFRRPLNREPPFAWCQGLQMMYRHRLDDCLDSIVQVPIVVRDFLDYVTCFVVARMCLCSLVTEGTVDHSFEQCRYLSSTPFPHRRLKPCCCTGKPTVQHLARWGFAFSMTM